ncbi:unnamed protein product, partial [marine sediment metagenome]
RVRVAFPISQDLILGRITAQDAVVKLDDEFNKILTEAYGG